MKKSIRSSLWLRLIPVLFLVLIPVIFMILLYGFDPPQSAEEFVYFLVFIILFLCLPDLILMIITFIFPLVGGIISLVLIPLIIFVFRDGLATTERIWIIWVICVCLFLSGASGLFIGIWNSRGKRNQVKNLNNNSKG